MTAQLMRTQIGVQKQRYTCLYVRYKQPAMNGSSSFAFAHLFLFQIFKLKLYSVYSIHTILDKRSKSLMCKAQLGIYLCNIILKKIECLATKPILQSNCYCRHQLKNRQTWRLCKDAVIPPFFNYYKARLDCEQQNSSYFA